MKRVTVAITLFISLLSLGNIAQAQSAAKTEIEKLIFAYRDALNASDVGKVVGLYTTDGVLLPNAAPTAVGADQVKGTYQYVFENIKLNLDFTIGEIVVSGDQAFARSTSKGTMTIKASGKTLPDENRELFTFQKVNGQWKIARYMYNKAQ